MRRRGVPIVQQSGNPPQHRGYAARPRSIAWTLLSRGEHRDEQAMPQHARGEFAWRNAGCVQIPSREEPFLIP